jgi:adenylate cyclase
VLERAQRRLAAILAADVVGYSRLVGQDEAATLRRLKELRRSLIDPIIREHHGRVVKTTGDGILIEFPSTVEAVHCAVRVQRSMAEAEDKVPPDRRITFRIGIHEGDVVVEGGDLFGDGVNVASRLEGLCEAGGVCISGRVHEDTVGRLDLPFEDRGEHAVKNIARPIHLFALSADAVSRLPPSSEKTPATPSSRSRRMWTSAAIVLLLFVGGAVTSLWFHPNSRAPQLSPAPSLSIVVLPFENLSNDREQDYFAEGLNQDITTDLSRIPGSFVIAHNTAMTYKGKAVDVKQIGRELGVRYVLEGSVQRAGDDVRVNVQLISAETGAHLWADRFNTDRSKLAELQDDVTARLARALDVQLTEAESRRAERDTRSDPDAVMLAMRGWAALNRTTSRENLMEARGFFERALQIDPQSQRAFTGLGRALSFLVLTHLSTDLNADTARANEIADTILKVHPDDAQAHYVKAQVFRAQKRFDEATVEYETAIADDRNFAASYAGLGQTKTFLGRPEEAIAPIEAALRLSPRDPLLNLWLFYKCHAYTHLAQDDKAIEWCQKSVAIAPYWFAYVDLGSAYAWKGEQENAHNAVQALLKMMPGYTVSKLAAEDWSKEPAFVKQYARIVEGAKKAGLPE